MISSLLIRVTFVGAGISNDGRGFPLSGALQNIEDGWSCFWGKDPPTSGRLYDVSNADCANCGWLLVAYVLAAVVVIECIDRCGRVGACACA